MRDKWTSNELWDDLLIASVRGRSLDWSPIDKGLKWNEPDALKNETRQEIWEIISSDKE